MEMNESVELAVEENSVHQGLMDKAFEKWQKDKGSFTDFIHSLDVVDRDAVVLGVLNYQVENGGFLQWIHNGYHVSLSCCMRALKRVDTESAKQVRNILGLVSGLVSEVVDDDDYDDDRYGNDVSESRQRALDELDSAYYKHSDQLIKDYEAYFKKEVEHLKSLGRF